MGKIFLIEIYTVEMLFLLKMTLSENFQNKNVYGGNVKLTLLEMAIHLNRAMPVKESIELMPGQSLVCDNPNSSFTAIRG